MSLLGPLNPPLVEWRDKLVWLVGASSGIGRATAVALLAQGARVAVSARNEAALNALAAEHAPAVGQAPRVIVLPLDARDGDAIRAAHASLAAQGPIDLVLYCAGYYQAMRATAFDLKTMLLHDDINYGGALRVLDAVLPALLARGSGHIALVSSVAGYRGLPQSLAYGPTKAALTNLAEVLYTDLRPRGIGVSVVQPGFVETPLTAQNEFKMPALITPAQAADEMLAGWAHGRFEIHFPRRFTNWLKLMRLLPYRLYFSAIKRFTGL